jgi:hypothetical protein
METELMEVMDMVASSAEKANREHRAREREAAKFVAK